MHAPIFKIFKRTSKILQIARVRSSPKMFKKKKAAKKGKSNENVRKLKKYFYDNVRTEIMFQFFSR